MTNYTTVDKVRYAAGFVWNSDITDAEILELINEIHWTIISRLSTKYDVSELDDSNTNFVASPAYYKLSLIEKLRTAGQLLVGEYGPEWTEDKDKWYQKINKARKDLEMIFADPPERLIWINNVEFTTVSISWPGSITSWGIVWVNNRIDKDTKF